MYLDCSPKSERIFVFEHNEQTLIKARDFYLQNKKYGNVNTIPVTKTKEQFPWSQTNFQESELKEARVTHLWLYPPARIKIETDKTRTGLVFSVRK